MDVAADLSCSPVVGDECGEYGLDVGAIVLACLGAGWVDDEFPAHQLGSCDGAGLDRVAGRSAVEPDDRFELVPPVRGGREAEPSPGPGPLDARRKRDGGKVVALVDDHEPVPVEHRRVVATGQALQHRDIDHAGRPVLAAADLADLLLRKTKVVGET